jgi:hypothetical protein
MRRMTLDAFLDGDERSSWIHHGTLKVYVRKATRLTEKPVALRVRVLDVANITNVRRPMNSARKPRHRTTGQLRTFDLAVKKAARERGFDGVFWENVLNEFLPEVLVRYGYVQVNENCFIWLS